MVNNNNNKINFHIRTKHEERNYSAILPHYSSASSSQAKKVDLKSPASHPSPPPLQKLPQLFFGVCLGFFFFAPNVLAGILIGEPGLHGNPTSLPGTGINVICGCILFFFVCLFVFFCCYSYNKA